MLKSLPEVPIRPNVWSNWHLNLDKDSKFKLRGANFTKCLVELVFEPQVSKNLVDLAFEPQLSKVSTERLKHFLHFYVFCIFLIFYFLYFRQLPQCLFVFLAASLTTKTKILYTLCMWQLPL